MCQSVWKCGNGMTSLCDSYLLWTCWLMILILSACWTESWDDVENLLTDMWHKGKPRSLAYNVRKQLEYFFLNGIKYKICIHVQCGWCYHMTLTHLCLVFFPPFLFPYRFLGTLKQHILQSCVHGDDDLNVEHLQLLLLLFHNMSERGRRSVLALVTQAITEVAQNRDSQLKAVPLNLARLCLIFDYLLRHYSKTPLYLFEQVTFSFIQVSCLLPCLLWAKGHYGYVLLTQVQYNLLTPPCSEPGSVQDAGKRSSLPLYCSFKEVEENWLKHCSAGKTTLFI